MKVEREIISKRTVSEDEAFKILEALKIHGKTFERLEEAVDKKLTRK